MANRFSATWTPKRAQERVLHQIGEIEKLLDADALVKWAGPEVRKAVAGRTSKGVDVEDRKFEGYSDDYADRKKGGRRSPVTLTDSGEMLHLLEFRKTGKASGKVYVRTGGHPNRAAVAAAHQHGAGNVPQRRWLGMSPADMKLLNRETLLWLERALALKGPGLKKTGSKAFVPRGSTVWTVKNP